MTLEKSADSIYAPRFAHDRFGVVGIGEALDEALGEQARESRTDLWTSFWDRLTDGTYIPQRPEEASDD